MKLSKKRETAIYSAVFDRIMTLRVELSTNDKVSAAIDTKIARAMDEAADAAVKAARGEVSDE